MSNECQICKQKFDSKDLFPVALIRTAAFLAAKKKYPDLDVESFVCYPDLRHISGLHFEEILRQDGGEITPLEEEVLESLKKHEILSENINEEYEVNLTFGDRLADKIAKFGGSWTFITIFGVVLFSWMGMNSIQLLQKPFDPYPFIFLNLILSCLAAIQAPIIMMSQNRQSFKDRLSQDNDYQVNLKAELQIRQLNGRMELFMKHQWQKMQEVTRVQKDILREIENKRLE